MALEKLSLRTLCFLRAERTAAKVRPGAALGAKTHPRCRARAAARGQPRLGRPPDAPPDPPIRPTSLMSAGTHSASCAMPPFPGAHQTFSYRRAAPQTPSQRVFASAAPDHKNFHRACHDNGSMRRCQRPSALRLRPIDDWCSHLKAMQLVRSFRGISLRFCSLLGIAVPWRGAVRVRALLARPALSSKARIAIYASTIAFQWLLAGAHRLAVRRARMELAESGSRAGESPGSPSALALALAAALALVQLAAFRQLGRVAPERRGRLTEIAAQVDAAESDRGVSLCGLGLHG